MTSKKVSVSDAILEILRESPSYSMELSDINNLLSEKIKCDRSSISHAKGRLLKNRKIDEKIVNGKKIITLLEIPKKENLQFCDNDYKSSLVQFFKDVHIEDIINEKSIVEVDTSVLVGSGFDEFVEYLIDDPEKALLVLSDAYNEAYYLYHNKKADVVVTIKRLVDETTIENIKSKDLNRLIQFEGIVSMASKIKAALVEGIFHCSNCGNTFTVPIDPLNSVKELPCRCNGNAHLDEKNSKYIDFQELKVQQPIEQMENPEDPPKYMTIIYENAKGIYSGRVRIIGIPIRLQSTKKLAVYNIVIKAINVIPVSSDKVVLSEKDEEDVISLSKVNNVIDVLAENLFPEIEGHSTIKKAILLQQIRGTEKPLKRNTIHILLITDPGVGKSVLLQKIAKMPGNTYASANTSSGVGLTATVERMKTEVGDDTWVIKPGVIPKAHGYTVSIDEFATNDSIKNYLLEVMEHMKLSINKASISTTLPAATSILAACNPKRGKYDPELTVWEQIPVEKPLLSRFDLIFPLRDYVDEELDEKIANRILELNNQLVNNEDIDKKIIEVDGKQIELTFDFICKYIRYASCRVVTLSDEAKEVLSKFYISLRKETKKAGESITPRRLESVIRITEAIAKIKLKDVADKEDAKEAVDLLMSCYKETLMDSKTGLLDFAKLRGVPKSEVEILDNIKEVIKHLEQTKKVPVSFFDLEEVLCEDGISEEQLNRYLNKLVSLGEVVEVKSGKYKLL